MERIKFPPNQIWTECYHTLRVDHRLNANIEVSDTMNNIDRIHYIQRNIYENARDMIQKPTRPSYQVGDRVRISLRVTDAKVRERLKDRRGKTVVVKYTPDI